MTPQERQMLADLFERVRANSGGQRDPEAEAFIGDAVRAAPHAPYVLAQTALVQQHALEAAAQRISELEARVAQASAPPQETSFLGSLGKSLFGGGASSAPPPSSAPPRSSYDASGYQRGAPDPAPAYRQPAYAPPPPAAPPQSGGPWGSAAPSSGGGGFLSNAMTTAAGVAGGIAAVDLFQNLLGGHRSGGLFGATSGGLGGGETVVNNYYDSDPAGQHAEDVLQDQDQDQDDAQDAGWDDSGSDSSGDYDT